MRGCRAGGALEGTELGQYSFIKHMLAIMTRQTKSLKLKSRARDKGGRSTRSGALQDALCMHQAGGGENASPPKKRKAWCMRCGR